MNQKFLAEFVFDEDLHGTKTYVGSATSCLEQLDADIRSEVIPSFNYLISLTAINCTTAK